jgi:hypothetical protein
MSGAADDDLRSLLANGLGYDRPAADQAVVRYRDGIESGEFDLAVDDLLSYLGENDDVYVSDGLAELEVWVNGERAEVALAEAVRDSGDTARYLVDVLGTPVQVTATESDGNHEVLIRRPRLDHDVLLDVSAWIDGVQAEVQQRHTSSMFRWAVGCTPGAAISFHIDAADP